MGSSASGHQAAWHFSFVFLLILRLWPLCKIAISQPAQTTAALGQSYSSDFCLHYSRAAFLGYMSNKKADNYYKESEQPTILLNTLFCSLQHFICTNDSWYRDDKCIGSLTHFSVTQGVACHFVLRKA